MTITFDQKELETLITQYLCKILPNDFTVKVFFRLNEDGTVEADANVTVG